MRGKNTKIVAFCQNNNVKEIINIEVEAEAEVEIKAEVEVGRFLTLTLTLALALALTRFNLFATFYLIVIFTYSLGV
jgi:hypothetical protein